MIIPPHFCLPHHQLKMSFVQGGLPYKEYKPPPFFQHHICYKVFHPKGDADNPFSWDEVVSKFKQVAISNDREAHGEQVARLVRAIDTSASLRPLLESLT